KRVGVEPTKDRLAAFPGFEVRTPHQGRFPSINRRWLVVRSAKQIAPVFVDAAKISAPQRHAMAIEEFQDLDRNLAAVVELVAELGGTELAVRCLCRKIGGDVGHL